MPSWNILSPLRRGWFSGSAWARAWCPCFHCGTACPSAQHKGHARLPAAPFASKAMATKPQPGMQSLPRRKRLPQQGQPHMAQLTGHRKTLHQHRAETSSPPEWGTDPLYGGNGSTHPWVKSPAAKELATDPSTLHPLKLGSAQYLGSSALPVIQSSWHSYEVHHSSFQPHAAQGKRHESGCPCLLRWCGCRSSLGVHGLRAGICTAGVQTGHGGINVLQENTSMELN